MPTWVSVPLDFEARPQGKSDVFARSTEPFSADLGKVSLARDTERQAFFEDQLRRVAWHLGSDTIPVFIDFNGDKRRMDKGCIGHAVAGGVLKPPVDGPVGYVEEVELVGEDSSIGQVQLWQSYSREIIPTLFGHAFNAGTWQQGFIVQGRDVFLLITLDKSGLGEEHHYDDGFISPTRLRWQSQNRTTQGSKHGLIIQQQLPGYAIHLFVRAAKKQASKASPFIYCGDVDFVSWEGEQPITVEWRLRDALPQHLFEAFSKITS